MGKKIVLTTIFYLFLYSENVLGYDFNCDKKNKMVCINLLNNLCIDPNIKTVKGWKRVCHNGKIMLYTCDDNHKIINKKELKEACDCLTFTKQSDIELNSFYIYKDGE